MARVAGSTKIIAFLLFIFTVLPFLDSYSIDDDADAARAAAQILQMRGHHDLKLEDQQRSKMGFHLLYRPPSPMTRKSASMRGV